jgi:hypothetical protein
MFLGARTVMRLGKGQVSTNAVVKFIVSKGVDIYN